jgi:hypothetical protein
MGKEAREMGKEVREMGKAWKARKMSEGLAAGQIADALENK